MRKLEPRDIEALEYCFSIGMTVRQAAEREARSMSTVSKYFESFRQQATNSTQAASSTTTPDERGR